MSPRRAIFKPMSSTTRYQCQPNPMPFPFQQRGTPAPVLSQSPTIESKASYGLTTGLNRGLYPISTQKHLAHGWKLTCLMSIPGQLQVDQCALDSYKANLVSFLPQSKARQDSIIPGANILLPIDSLCWSNLMPILGQFSANVASEAIQNLCHT